MTEGIEYISPPVSAGGASGDHGDLTGLGDDDHPQYETSAEAAAKVTTHEAAADPHTGYVLESGTSTVRLLPVAAPSAPASGSTLYVDTADSKLKAIKASGDIIEVG